MSASGNFELQLLEISNTNSHLLTGYCCGVSNESRNIRTTGCPPCQTAFRLCLKEYQTTSAAAAAAAAAAADASSSSSSASGSNPSKLSGCSFGNASSKVLGGSSFVLSDPNVGSIVLPFSFRWTVSFFFYFYYKYIHQLR